MDEPTTFGAVVRCRLRGEPGHAVSTGQRMWTFRASNQIAQSGLSWRELDAIEVVFAGVVLPGS